MPKEKKVTNAVGRQRVISITQMLQLFYTRKQIIQNVSEPWNISERQIDFYIRRATNVILEMNKNTIEQNQATILSAQAALFRTCIKEKNASTARQILMDMAKIRGLDQATLTVNVLRDKDLMNLSDDELDAITRQD